MSRMRGGSQSSINDLILTDKSGASQTNLSIRVASLERVLGSIMEDMAQIAVASETLHRVLWAWGLQPEEWHAARHDIDEMHRKGEAAELAPINPSLTMVRSGGIQDSIIDLNVRLAAFYTLLVGDDNLISFDEFADACTKELQNIYAAVTSQEAGDSQEAGEATDNAEELPPKLDE